MSGPPARDAPAAARARRAEAEAERERERKDEGEGPSAGGRGERGRECVWARACLRESACVCARDGARERARGLVRILRAYMWCAYECVRLHIRPREHARMMPADCAGGRGQRRARARARPLCLGARATCAQSPRRSLGGARPGAHIAYRIVGADAASCAHALARTYAPPRTYVYVYAGVYALACSRAHAYTVTLSLSLSLSLTRLPTHTAAHALARPPPDGAWRRYGAPEQRRPRARAPARREYGRA